MRVLLRPPRRSSGPDRPSPRRPATRPHRPWRLTASAAVAENGCDGSPRPVLQVMDERPACGVEVPASRSGHLAARRNERCQGDGRDLRPPRLGLRRRRAQPDAARLHLDCLQVGGEPFLQPGRQVRVSLLDKAVGQLVSHDAREPRRIFEVAGDEQTACPPYPAEKARWRLGADQLAVVIRVVDDQGFQRSDFHPSEEGQRERGVDLLEVADDPLQNSRRGFAVEDDVRSSNRAPGRARIQPWLAVGAGQREQRGGSEDCGRWAKSVQGSSRHG